jgi:tetratricopeptide (TPR) repeat protein
VKAALRVPLIVRQPRQKAGGVVRETVGLIDIVPTICGLLKVQPPGSIQGADLTPLLKGREMAEAGRSYYCESLTATKYGGNSLLGVVQGNWKYIQTTRPELYDLEKDSREEKNLVSGRPDLAASLQGRLRAVLESEVRTRAKGKPSELDPKALAGLAALGYIRGSVVEDFSFAADKDDPKDLIAFHETYSRAHLLVGEGQFSEAKGLYESLASQRPKYAGTYFSLAGIAFRQRDYAEAVRILPKAIELDPNDYLYPLYLGIALFKLNRLSEALVHLQEAEKLEPRSSEVLANHGLALLRAKRVEEGAEKLQKAVQFDPQNDIAHQGLAQAYSLAGRPDDAIAECTKVLEINPANIEVQNNLGMLHYKKGNRPKALASWKESLRLNPNQPAVLEPAIRALLEEGQADQALPWLESLLRLQPRNTRVMCRIALLKADSRYPQLSDPAGSLVLARQAREISGERDALSLYALAAALAALKKPTEAADAASQALGLAQEAGDTALVANIGELLEFCKRSPAGGGRQKGLRTED